MNTLLCYDYALGYLRRYQKTITDMKKQLQKKSYEAGEITSTLEKLIEIGLLDDERYAEQYIYSEVIRKKAKIIKEIWKFRHKWFEQQDIIKKLQTRWYTFALIQQVMDWFDRN